MMESGHRSLSSNTKGRQRSTDVIQPATAAKNCGEVATTMSGRFTNSAAMVALTM